MPYVPPILRALLLKLRATTQLVAAPVLPAVPGPKGPAQPGAPISPCLSISHDGACLSRQRPPKCLPEFSRLLN